jgi:hypothetical protein
MYHEIDFTNKENDFSETENVFKHLEIVFHDKCSTATPALAMQKETYEPARTAIREAFAHPYLARHLRPDGQRSRLCR